ncbi:MAG: glycosyltransferase family 39 protein [Verrucomicrobiota bacterium]|nr:glycosyltransferase family 39 protein [Verrucomicrobiota bacterium]
MSAEKISRSDGWEAADLNKRRSVDRRSLMVLGVVSALTLVLFLGTNLPWQLDEYDQAKQATTSLEMIKEGHWLYQHTSDNHVATKPPLVGWISAALFAVTRSWEVAWRLPSLVSAIAIAIILFRAGTAAYGGMAGLMALSAFGLNLLSPRLATLVRSDMPLALVVFLIGLQIWQKIRSRDSWKRRDRFVIFALLTLGMLIKGPIIYAFLLPGIVLFQWRVRKEKAPSAWCGWWPWLTSLGIFLLWVIGGIATVPHFFDQVVMREFVSRFGETVHHPKPIYFYLPHLLHKFAPWSILMIAIAVLSMRSEKIKVRAALRRIRPEVFWLIAWSLGGLLVMSIIPSKRVDRIFPVVPPLCLLLAAQLSATLPDERGRRRVLQWSTVAVIIAALFTTGYCAFRIISGYRDHRDAMSIFGRAAREQAVKNDWRLEAVGESDEGMPLYLERPHFIESEQAVADWNAGRLDALAVPIDEMPRLIRDLRDAVPPTLESVQRKNLPRRPNYVLITR